MNMATDHTAWRAALKTANDSERNWWVAFILSLALGFYGIDRFYLRSHGLGLLKFVTVGGGLAWWLIDLVLLFSNKMRDAEGGIVRRPF